MTEQVTARTTTVSTLHGSLSDRALSSMNFLNQVADEYPDAVSFAAGRPYEGFFDTVDVADHLRLFREHLRRDLGYRKEEVDRTLFQYGRTKGVINHLVARHLEVDENVRVDQDAIVVTVGCQEAMFLVLRALRAGREDVVLAAAPTYVGLTGAALLADLPVHPVRTDATGLDVADLVTQVRTLRAAGRRPRACYVTPDFANPTGASMSVPGREHLLTAAEEENILLLEDNAYGLFSGEGVRPPTLKALDRAERVVYLGSFAKSGLPGARVGYVVADQHTAEGAMFADELAKIKSMLTVNTSPLAQAVIGGKLLAHGCSLHAANRREIEVYRRNLALVLDGLSARFASSSGVSWNRPSGGFFVTVTVPFTVDDALLEYSARRHGVLWTPMHHFYGGAGGYHQLRLSCSSLTPGEITDGLDRLAGLFRDPQVTGA